MAHKDWLEIQSDLIKWDYDKPPSVKRKDIQKLIDWLNDQKD